MKTYNTQSANPKLVDLIIEKNNKLLEDGKVQFEAVGDKDVKEVGSNKYIISTEWEKYDALNRLYSLISFKNDIADYNLYEFPGFEMGGQKMRLAVPTSKAGELAEKAEYIEKNLKDYGVKFPAQLYALKPEYRGKNLPGKDYPAPSPKLMSQTDEEYEKYLEEYYKPRGVEKESDGLAFRKPYQHEKIDYREANETKDEFVSEYYQDQLEIHAKGKGKTTKAPIGERLKVAFKSLPNPDLKGLNDRVKNRINWKNTKSKVIKIAAYGAGVLAAGALLSANPLAFITVASLGGSFALGHYLRKKIEQFKAKRRIDKEEAEQRKKEEEEAKKREEAKRKAAEEKDKTQPAPAEPVQTAEPIVKPVQPIVTGTNPTQPDPSGPYVDGFTDEMIYDTEQLGLAEEDLGLDHIEYNRILGELSLVKAQIAEKEGKELDDSEKEELHNLKVQEIQLMKDRLRIAQILVDKQETLLTNLENSKQTRTR